MNILQVLLLTSSTTLVSATTEWWGDLRAHLNPTRFQPFYDVTYDEKAATCPQGIRADAIPEFVYFGTMLATMTVDVHDKCLQRCAEKPRCKAVNYFHPFSYQERGFCELLTEGQHDNPSLMRPFRKATYYENIRCREASEDVVDVDTGDDDGDITTGGGDSSKTVEASPEKKTNLSNLMKKLSAKVKQFNSSGDFRRAR